MRQHLPKLLWLSLASLLVVEHALAERISDVVNTKHNLSAIGPAGRTVSALSQDQVCVFCHTPHGATSAPGAPLWNRQLNESQTYTRYTSSSLDAETIQGQLDQPGGSSKLCLSCHDGTLAIGQVNVAGGQQNVAIAMSGTAPDGSMPSGAGAQTGFSRDLGTDLRNDHPISLTYDSTLANLDGELVDPAAAAHIGLREPGVRPTVPLEPTGNGGAAQLQCASCHDPHIRDTDITKNIKFLRLNRLQETQPADGSFNQTGDIVCLACHDKIGWAGSAHALPTVANETYSTSAANLREFPANLPVWQAACLNCHDTHTVQGARRLLREGTDSISTPKSGGDPAIEETCYQCHQSNPIISNTAGEVPDIKTDFTLLRHMPISNTEQLAGSEVHDIVDAELSENPTLLGKGNLNNRHAECSDCHNPHRVKRNRVFNGIGVDPEGTHNHTSGHSNIASGVLAGAWGVEPNYGGTAFLDLPLSYTIKQGAPGLSTDVNNPYVTREYQICLKCHSDFGYDDTGIYPNGSRPNLGASGGTTPSYPNHPANFSNTNPAPVPALQYTNQAMEFQAPLGDTGEPGGNHRSWHPVIAPTERTAAVRNMSASTNLFRAPWNGSSIGNQTMYCSDCHGSSTGNTTVEPSGNNPWGPHGSNNDFILKGGWNSATGADASGLCFRCHDYTNYATDQNEGDREGFESGFGCNRDQFPDADCKDTNLHAFHAKRIDTNLRCTWCHAAVPHGWKNKALLVNLNDVGPEAGFAPGTEVPIQAHNQSFSQAPYYLNAKLKVRTFAPSGGWEASNCGSASGNPDVGRDWMDQVCRPNP